MIGRIRWIAAHTFAAAALVAGTAVCLGAEEVREVPLGFAVKDIAVDPAGGRALAVGPLDDVPAGGGADGASDRSELVLIDLSAGKVLARRRLTVEVEAVGLTKSAAGILPLFSRRMPVLAPDDLSERKVVNHDAVFNRMHGTPDGGVLLTGSNLPAAFWDGERVAPVTLRERNDHRTTLTDALRAVHFGVDPQTRERSILLDTGGLPAVAAAPGKTPASAATMTGAWGHRVDGFWLTRCVPGAERREFLPHRRAVILRRYPVVAEIHTRLVLDEALYRTAVSFFSLPDLAPAGEVTLSRTPLPPPGINPVPIPVADLGDRLVIAMNHSLFVVTLPAERLGRVPRPLHFETRLLPLTARVGGRVELRFALGGPADDARDVKLAPGPGSAAGTRLDAARRTATLDTAAAWAEFRQCVAGDKKAPSAEAARAAYGQVFGAETTGYPFAARVEVMATKGTQAAALAGYVVLIAPGPP
jgi:hypothetical protein